MALFKAEIQLNQIRSQHNAANKMPQYGRVGEWASVGMCMGVNEPCIPPAAARMTECHTEVHYGQSFANLMKFDLVGAAR